MKWFWIVLAVLTACVAVGFFMLIPRNEFAWMATELRVGETLPIDDLQSAKERISLALLALSLALFGALAVAARTWGAIVGAASGAAIVSSAWYWLFWSM